MHQGELVILLPHLLLLRSYLQEVLSPASPCSIKVVLKVWVLRPDCLSLNLSSTSGVDLCKFLNTLCLSFLDYKMGIILPTSVGYSEYNVGLLWGLLYICIYTQIHTYVSKFNKIYELLIKQTNYDTIIYPGHCSWFFLFYQLPPQYLLNLSLCLSIQTSSWSILCLDIYTTWPVAHF